MTTTIELLIGLGVLVVVIILLIIGLIYLWHTIESLEEVQENLEQDLSLESKKLTQSQLQARGLNNTLLKAKQEIQRLTNVCVNAEKSIKVLNLNKLEAEKKIEQLSNNCIENEKTIKNLDSALKIERFNLQAIYRNNTRTDVLTTIIKEHRQALILSLKNTLKDDDIQISLLPDYQYQISFKKIDEPLFNFKELLASITHETIVKKRSEVIIFNPIHSDIEKIMKHANNKYGNHCGITHNKYEESLDDFITHIKTL